MPVYILGANILELAIEHKITSFWAKADSYALSQQDECKCIAILRK